MNNGSNTVLVVDDDDDIRFLLTMILEQEGYKVETAADGSEGLAAVKRRMPDLIFLDMKMPVMNGSEFAREFHAKYDSQAPIVVLTAAVDPEKCAKETGAVGWISKPFDLNTLVETTCHHLKKQ